MPNGFRLDFLRDGIGRPITVNNNYNVSAGRAGNTTYDGATPTLRARAAVEDGETFTFTAYIADVGDSVWDSNLFQVQEAGDEERQAGPCNPG